MSSSRPHRCDEFPAEYSLASCSPAELASASSAAPHAATNNTCSSSYFQRTVTGEFLYCLNRGGHPNSLTARGELPMLHGIVVAEDCQKPPIVRAPQLGGVIKADAEDALAVRRKHGATHPIVVTHGKQHIGKRLGNGEVRFVGLRQAPTLNRKVQGLSVVAQ